MTNREIFDHAIGHLIKDRRIVAPRSTKAGFRITPTGWTSPCGISIATGEVQAFLQTERK